VRNPVPTLGSVTEARSAPPSRRPSRYDPTVPRRVGGRHGYTVFPDLVAARSQSSSQASRLWPSTRASRWARLRVCSPNPGVSASPVV